MDTQKNPYIKIRMVVALTLVLGIAYVVSLLSGFHGKMMPVVTVPPAIAIGEDTIRIGVPVKQLAKRAGVWENTYGGWSEARLKSRYFEGVGYLDRHGMVERATLTRYHDSPQFSVREIHELETACSEYYKRPCKTYIVRDPGKVVNTVKVWNVGGEYVCLYYSALDDSIRSGAVDSADVALIIGATASQWVTAGREAFP